MRAIAPSSILAVLLSSSVLADVEFDIPSQPVGDALNQFAEQSGLQVVIYAADAEGVETEAVQGTFDEPTEALDVLLSANGLEYAFINDRTVSVSATFDEERGDSDSKNSQPMPALMTQNTIPTPASENQEANEDSAADETDGEPRSERGMPEIIVTGRSTNVDIRRSVDDIQPYVVFGSHELENSQAVNLENFLQSRLPMNASASPNTVRQFGDSDAELHGTNINLRGLGSNQTLILVNGRRMAGISCCGTILQPDINSIPIGSIERIEVLPTTAGGIYGASANGGVINIVLKRNYTGGELIARYSDVVDGGAMTRSIEGNVGFSLFRGTTDVLVSASIADAGDPLLQGDRHFAERARALAALNNAEAFSQSFLPPIGVTTNIKSLAGELVLDPEYGGLSLNSTFTHVPPGYGGVASDSGTALVANAGQYNLDVPNDLNGLKSSLWDGPISESISLNVHSSLNDAVELFLESHYAKNEKHRVSGLILVSSVFLDANAPTNPFQQPVFVAIPTPQLTSATSSKSENLRVSGGVITRLPGNWAAVLDYTWGRSRLQSVSDGARIDFSGRNSLRTGLPSGDGRPVLDALQESNTHPLDFGPYEMPLGHKQIGPADSTTKDLSFRLAGPVATLPAGPLNISMSLARNESETKDSFVTELSTFDRTPLYSLHRALSNRVDTAYAEATIPLISEASALSYVHSLDIQASVRSDRYKTSAPPNDSFSALYYSSKNDFPNVQYVSTDFRSTESTLGFRYMPKKSLTIRASAGTGYLPPCFTCISSTTTLWQHGPLYPDPKRGGLTGPFIGGEGSFEFVYGGRSDVLPENSESWSAGIIYAPESFRGLRLSVDFVRIDKVNEIGTVSAAFVLANEDGLFANRVDREPLSDADAALGYTGGRVTRLDTTSVNLAHTSLEAYDFQINYRIATDRWGEFNAYAVGTWTRSFYQQVSPELPEKDIVGLADGPLEWRGNLGVDWSKGPWKIGWNAQYYDGYNVAGRFDSEAVAARKSLVQGASTIPSQTYHDIIAVYRFAESERLSADSIFKKIELSLGIQNVFDRAPPIVVTQSPIFVESGFSPYGDPRMRRYTVGATIRF